jgi:hypothetical protein
MTPVVSVRSLLSRAKIGLLLRVYATEEQFIPDRVSMVMDFVNRVAGITVEGMRVISQVNVVVWNNPAYGNRSDCGKTFAILNDAVQDFAGTAPRVHIDQVKAGDLYCSVLNYGIMAQARSGCDYTIVASGEAASYFTPETMKNVVQAAADGARAVGVVINELTPSVMRGRLANTFAMWHNLSLAQVGLFDKRAQMPLDPEYGRWSFGWEKGKGEVKYPNAGVEEIIPLCRMFQEFGQCTAPVLPAGEGVLQYQMPDPAFNPVEWERQQAKWMTKAMRQSSLAENAGFNISAVEGAVMDKYRTF